MAGLRRMTKRKAVLSTKSAGTLEQRRQPAGSKVMSLAPVDPRSLGMDSSKLNEYEGAMQQIVRQGAIPGCASVVFFRGHIVQAGSWGHADLEHGKPFRLDTLCRLYCMTKSYVAATFMTCVDEGLVTLEDRLDKYLPSFASMYVKGKGKAKAVKADSPILLKHLLSHTSGIDYAPDLGCTPEDAAAESYLRLQREVQRGTVRTLAEFVQRLSKLPLSCHPGRGYYYGYSMDVLARVVEVVLHRSLEECLRERLFEPLGMRDTLWAVPDRQLHRLAAIYGDATTWGNLYGGEEGQVPITTQNGLIRIDGREAKDSHWHEGQQCSVVSGGGFMGYLYGGLVSTVADTVQFVHMLLNYGVAPSGQRLLQESTVAILEKDRLKSSWGAGRACYIGNKGVFREADEYGMGGAACTYWSIDREDSTATVWFAQHLNMPEFEDLKLPKADLWKVLHEAVRKAPKKAAAGKRSHSADHPSPAKRQRRPSA